MTWLLDTNVLIHAQRGRPQAVRLHLRSRSPEDIATSAISIADLWYGAAKHADPASKRELLKQYLEPDAVHTFDKSAAEIHGDLRYHLRHDPIGHRDSSIAAIALGNDLTLVPNNTREFERVPELNDSSMQGHGRTFVREPVSMSAAARPAA
jgi:tRNA(fMet)-specific endonuclease VapC